MVERNLIGAIAFECVIQFDDIGSILRELIGRSIAANDNVPRHLWCPERPLPCGRKANNSPIRRDAITTQWSPQSIPSISNSQQIPRSTEENVPGWPIAD